MWEKYVFVQIGTNPYNYIFTKNYSGLDYSKSKCQINLYKFVSKVTPRGVLQPTALHLTINRPLPGQFFRRSMETFLFGEAVHSSWSVGVLRQSANKGHGRTLIRSNRLQKTIVCVFCLSFLLTLRAVNKNFLNVQFALAVRRVMC